MSANRSRVASVAIASLFAGLAAIGLTLLRQDRHMEAAVQAPAESFRLDAPGDVLMADGVDQNGKIVDRMPPGTVRMVAFSLRGSDLSEELEFWQRVRRSAGSGTFFLGICVDKNCTLRAQNLRADLPILVAGELTGMVAMLQARAASSFLVTDGRARIVAEVQIQRSSREVAAGIRAAR
jgi:hypothetical protein